MKPQDLTDEQFREARRQIVCRLEALAEGATTAALAAVESDCRNAQNPQARMDEVERARGYRNAASTVRGMEREGFDWSGGIE